MNGNTTGRTRGVEEDSRRGSHSQSGTGKTLSGMATDWQTKPLPEIRYESEKGEEHIIRGSQ